MAELIPSCHLCGILMDTNPMLAVYEVAPHPKHPNHCIYCVKHYPKLLGSKNPNISTLPMMPKMESAEKKEQRTKEVFLILSLMNNGLGYEQIGKRLNISKHTIPRKLKLAGRLLGGDLIHNVLGHKSILTDFGKQILEKGV